MITMMMMVTLTLMMIIEMVMMIMMIIEMVMMLMMMKYYFSEIIHPDGILNCCDNDFGISRNPNSGSLEMMTSLLLLFLSTLIFVLVLLEILFLLLLIIFCEGHNDLLILTYKNND